MFDNNKYNYILQKKNIIQTVTLKLKENFIGLDGIVDEVMSLISPWFFFPETQVRPTIINLWGLTGTGKTALIKEIAELLDMKNSFLYLDMGEYSGSGGSWIKSMFTDDLEHFNGKPVLLCFDEFQFARTIDNGENELSREKMRVLWELFDSGKIYYEPTGSDFHTKRAELAIMLINKCIKNNVILSNGEIVSQVQEFLSIFSGYYFDSFERYGKEISSGYFLSKDFIEGIKEIFDDNNYSDDEIISSIKSFSLEEVAKWLVKGIRKKQSVKQLDLSKSLIFVLGNLDEAFYMSNELSPDLSADEFYAETLKINIADIKSALKKRFRNEQVARLGNNHLIYPSFNKKGYRMLIRKNLDRIAMYVKEKINVRINFNDSVIQVVYDEGVFPSQGVRPVLTTIKQMIESLSERFYA